MKRADYLKLLTLLHQVEVKSLAEIGVWAGFNAFELRQLFPEAHLYLIDPWELTPNYLEDGLSPAIDPYQFQQAYECTRSLFRDDQNVTILKKNSTDALTEVPNHLDLVFIDGNHSYRAVKDDIQNWRRKIRRGGLLTGHNYHPNFPGVIRAVHSYLKDQFQIGEDTIWFTQVETG
ncbi:class I SAM-dependent methyltransferase [Simkania negevensis]|uniref:Conserved hypothetical n=1 Tax=Simkania negevensis (strain ATCC VR-1471 / DSM 27360 / Z) TaxID=331113 RepID=F8L5M1_SIMNZ|nr:class I SAM-dependent methyltransferase [Simkania negevensis]CCB89783.1 conserved hypothetical [Simkania negevensis Z]